MQHTFSPLLLKMPLLILMSSLDAPCLSRALCRRRHHEQRACRRQRASAMRAYTRSRRQRLRVDVDAVTRLCAPPDVTCRAMSAYAALRALYAFIAH